MGVNKAGVGFVAVDLQPAILELSIREKPPGGHIDIEDYEFAGEVCAIEVESEDWKSYDTEFEQKSLIGVFYYGAITGYVGISGKYGFGPPSTKFPLTARAYNRLMDKGADNVAYEKKIKDEFKKSVLETAEDAQFNISCVMFRTRPFHPTKVKISSLFSEISSRKIACWGRQLAEAMVPAPTYKVIEDSERSPKRPTGMMCVGAGWRFWAIGGAAKYSSKKKRMADDDPDIEKGFKEVLKEIKDYRCWKKVRWKDDWIEAE